ncbi:glycoside hydrolase family 5 protein [Spirillospora sp. NPDC048911]|uniref:glycoside hydrolase family 5 protein n=1 Tax=Spirillospora sp. NPDC048911 TaxID=3364527 RepID=UPI00371677C8
MRRLTITFTAALAIAAVTGCSATAPSQEGSLAGAKSTALTRAKTSATSKALAGKLRTTAKQAFVGTRGPEQLNGPNLQPIWDANDPDTWGQDTYDQIRAKGFTAVRMVLFWDDFEPSKGQWNETAFGTLSTALDHAKNAGLYVIFDCVHLFGQPEGQSRVPEWARTTDGMGAVAANGLGFLQQLATRYGGNEALAAYDPVNEPYRWPVNHRTVLADYTKIVNALRAKDTTTSIMIEPTYGAAKVPDADLAALTPSNRTNLIWSFHDYYVGGKGEGYDANGIGVSPNASDGTTGYNAANKADLAKHLQVQLNTAAKAGMPVWVGEFGIGADATGHDQFIKDKVALYKSKGLGYSWWEYKDGSGAFSMIDHEDDSWRPWVGLLF